MRCRMGSFPRHLSLPMESSPPRRSFGVILNPVAGSRHADRLSDRLRALLAAHGVTYELVRTGYPRHAVALAGELAGSFDVVVAAGGDGTVQETASGLRTIPGATLGILPLGTGNDLAGLIGMPRRLEQAVAALLAAEAVAVDAGSVRWREEPVGPWRESSFLNAVGIGFDALVAAEAARFKRYRGKSAYLLGVVSALRQWTEPVVVVERMGPVWALAPDGSCTPLAAESGVEGALFLAAAGNGRSVGGGFRMTPHASLADGLLDFCLAAGVRSRRLPVLVTQVLRGTHIGAPEVTAERLAGLRLRSESGVPIHVDGEVLTRKAVEVEVRVVPRALRLLCPDPSLDVLRAPAPTSSP